MKANRLISEKSPYLLQHAHNPVDWHPWGEEAFAQAAREDKPIFLSIGYSTCHWCHVMAHESFENESVAALLNETFVNIKVDREERPDIDAVYMKVCQMMTQSGGWPLTIMMTQELQPFFAATYIPRETRYGRVGLLDMIRQVQTLWRTKRNEVLCAASEIASVLQKPQRRSDKDVSEEILHRAYRSLALSFDKTFGGFGPAPKFPSPHNFFFLLRYWKRTGQTQALRMVEKTLQSMRQGGIYDQIGFGFHRYSTDARWIVPHFEKMLYDQALMALAYLEVYQATGKSEYKKIVGEIFSYVLRDLRDPDGGFYSAEDADSEGTEGKFYLWTEREIRDVLSPDDAELFLSLCRHPGDALEQAMPEISPDLFIVHFEPSADGKKNFRDAEEDRFESIRKKLFAVREKRIRPYKDDKILADWNGLMIAALARGAQVFDDETYAAAAVEAMNFILSKMTGPDSGLLHRYRDGDAAVAGHIDDYSFVIWALLELYEATFDAGHLDKAYAFQRRLEKDFRDEENGGFFFTSKNAQALVIRPKELFDGAVPSGNSVAFQNALRLSRISGDSAWEESAHNTYRAFCASADAMPTAFTYFLSALDFAIGKACEVVIVGDPKKEDTRTLIASLQKSFLPNKVIIFLPEKDAKGGIEAVAPWTKEYRTLNGRATAYVCTDFSCSLPTCSSDEMIRLLNVKSPSTEAWR